MENIHKIHIHNEIRYHSYGKCFYGGYTPISTLPLKRGLS